MRANRRKATGSVVRIRVTDVDPRIPVPNDARIRVVRRVVGVAIRRAKAEAKGNWPAPSSARAAEGRNASTTEAAANCSCTEAGPNGGCTEAWADAGDARA